MSKQKNNRLIGYIFPLVIFYIGMLFSVMSQLFIVSRSNIYQASRPGFYATFGLLLLYCLVNTRVIGKFLLHYIIITVFAMIFGAILSFMFSEMYWSYIEELLLPLGILIISNYLDISLPKIKTLLFVYSAAVLLMGVLSVYYFGQGYTISKSYIIAGKNQIGPMFAISFIILLHQATGNILLKKYISSIIRVAMLFLIIMTLAVIRNRSGLVALAIVTILFVIHSLITTRDLRKRFYYLYLIPLIGIIAMANLFAAPVNFIKDAFVLGKKSEDIDSLSSGRVARVEDAINAINRNILWGDKTQRNVRGDIPHMYVVNKWLQWGVLGAFPLLILYIYLWVFVFKEILYKEKLKNSHCSIAPWLLSVILIMSFFEYAYPYGPGTSVFMVWFVVGRQQMRRICSGKSA